MQEVANKIDILAAETKGIFSTPPPKPETPTAAPTEPPKEGESKPEAEPTEIKNDPGADAEMK